MSSNSTSKCKFNLRPLRFHPSDFEDSPLQVVKPKSKWQPHANGPLQNTTKSTVVPKSRKLTSLKTCPPVLANKQVLPKHPMVSCSTVSSQTDFLHTENAETQTDPIDNGDSSCDESLLEFVTVEKSYMTNSIKKRKRCEDGKEMFKKMKQYQERNEQMLAVLSNSIKEQGELLDDLCDKFEMNSKEKCSKPSVSLKLHFDNMNDSCSNDNETSEVETFKDKELRKSVQMYNVLKKSFNGLLATPKYDRSYLQTPKRGQHDTISRKIQKQCFLLQSPNCD